MQQNIIVMGVSGSGKSTIGSMIARELDLEFLDADDFHPKSNKEKMAAGTPLTDEDRLPWLKTLQQQLERPHIVLACSALKTSYRDVLDPDRNHLWVFLNGSREVIAQRMSERKGHFMSKSLLDSQIDTLEVPKGVIEVNIDQAPEDIVTQILNDLQTQE
ncbi:gluconokinase [Marinoscillum furvescens]|uniref:Gluconokinase n=1 Tax=Marinoscillum furvescens DSM 4134 TaxID=1122208 RepID=A0A3D9KXS3_MARFU|nr:gluconokinase [Marinoscillum furvescens]RED91894.1 gluconate kinase (SKI family) [Marinoscillum furvescens DSM 4134]